MVVNSRFRAGIEVGKKFDIPVKILAAAVTGELLKVVKFPLLQLSIREDLLEVISKKDQD